MPAKPPENMLNRSSTSDANDETDDLRDIWLSRLNFDRDEVVRVEPEGMLCSWGVRGRAPFVRYAEAGARGGPITVGEAGRCSPFSAAKMASRWSAGSGGWLWPLETWLLVALSGRR